MSVTRKVLDYWFNGLKNGEPLSKFTSEKWFKGSPEIDAEIRSLFNIEQVSIPLDSSEDYLAAIIVNDQFPRNVFRNTPKMFAFDSKALKLSKEFIAKGFDRKIDPIHCVFGYMPLMRSEVLEDQELGVAKYSELLERAGIYSENIKGFQQFAQMHLDVIAKFGRFPRRNEVLGRISTPEELEYLATKPPF